MSLKKLLAITLLAMSTSLSALASDVVVPVDPVIEGQEVPAKGLYFSSSFEFELSSEVAVSYTHLTLPTNSRV